MLTGCSMTTTRRPVSRASRRASRAQVRISACRNFSARQHRHETPENLPALLPNRGLRASRSAVRVALRLFRRQARCWRVKNICKLWVLGTARICQVLNRIRRRFSVESDSSTDSAGRTYRQRGRHAGRPLRRIPAIATADQKHQFGFASAMPSTNQVERIRIRFNHRWHIAKIVYSPYINAGRGWRRAIQRAAFNRTRARAFLSRYRT